MEAKLQNLLLDPAAVSPKDLAHVEGCERCSRELDELRATMDLMDAWEVPEPSPYFLTRLEARQRELRDAGPVGWLARLRASFAFSSRAHVRPLAAMAMSVMLLVGGGAYLGIVKWEQQPAPAETAVVHDLQTMDSNAQLLDQLEALSSTDNSNDDGNN